MTPAPRWQHVRRITFYALLMFVGFVISWLVLLATVRSDGDHRPALVTEVEIHSLRARWGLDLLTVPIIAGAIALFRRSSREVGDVGIALVIGVAIAVGMAYFPAVVIGGHIPWPVTPSYFDTNGYIDNSLTYAIGAAAVLLFMNRIAAREPTTSGDTLTTP